MLFEYSHSYEITQHNMRITATIIHIIHHFQSVLYKYHINDVVLHSLIRN